MQRLLNWRKTLAVVYRILINGVENSTSRVKKTTLYLERNEEKRKQFRAEIEQLNSDDVVYVDESGIDPRIIRDYARAPRGKQVISDVCGKREQRTSLIAAWLPQAKKLIAPYAFEGTTDAMRFNGWLEKCLLPALRKGQVVVMDNAPFHKAKRTRELIESAGCRLLYQPEYSPDLNPIEQQWAVIKRKYRKAKYLGLNHYHAVNTAFN
jgi:transposase